MRIAAMLLALIVLCSACEQQRSKQTQKKPPAVGTQQAASATEQSGVVDPRWLMRAQRFDTAGNATDIVLEFARKHPSESLPIDRASYEEASPYLNILTVDLDEDADPEHLMLIGANYWDTIFYVIDQQGGQWRIVHEERVWMHNEEPELHILNTPSRNKTFYRKVVLDRGSGIWLFTDRFYRLINGTVQTVLEVVEESNLAIDASPLYQHAETGISTSGNDIVVKYSYGFLPSFTLARDLGIIQDYDELQDISLIEGEETVFYSWRPELNLFVPNFEDSKLSQGKVDCFMDLGETKLIVAAYQKELRGLLESGTDHQKKVARYLLTMPASEM